MTTTENVRAHLAPEAGEGASAYVDPLDIGDAILEVYDDHEPRIASLEASGNVGTSDLADSAVTTAKIADSAVTSAKIADSAVTSAKIADGTIVTGDLADSAVTSAKIADGTIATGDLADSAVTSAKIAAGTIVSSDLATSAVATSNIADSAVTSAKIADGTIVDADINAAAGIAKTKITGTALVESTATTKGDLLARGTSAVERLAVGAVGTNPILIPDTSASAGVKWGTWTEADVAQASKVGNLLTLNQATLETSTTGWSGYQVTLTRDTGTYYQGAASLKVASSTSSVGTKAANTSSTIPVTAGRVYTAQAQIKTDGVTYARVGVLFYSGGSPSGSVTYGNTVTATTWTASTVTATAPANADAVYVYVYLDPAAASGTYAYADALGMWAGAGGDWQLPGIPITGTTPTDGSITTAKIADSAVTSVKIADDTIVNADINSAAAIDVSKLSGVVATATVGNLLDYASATLDTSTGFWSGSASTRAVNTSDPYAGVGCLEATATGSAQFYVSASKTVQVTPGQPYTLTYAAKSATRNLQVYFTWTNAAGDTVLDQGITKGACTSWTVFSDTRVAPAGATCVTIHFYAMTAGSAGDTLLLDRIGLWAGAGGLWAPPGTPIANLGTYTDETVGRRIFTWDTANNRWQMTYGDTGWREINALQTAAALTKFPNAVLSVRRVNSSVDVRWFSDTGTVAGAAGTAICSTLTGFRPGVIQGRGIVGSAVNASSGLPSVHGVYSDGAALNIATTADSANNVLASLSYTTNDSWPTALPGNAIGTIPQ